MNNKFMRRAVELAKKERGGTRPNPCVGAVIVKGDQIVAEGWHKKAGDKHAEVIAIEKMMNKSGIVSVSLDPNLFQNATLYVTLEPCAHEGKTGPCAKLVADAGFKRVCVGMKDPFSKVNGKGIQYLKRKGVIVEVCPANSNIAKEVREINQPFIKWAKTGLPYVTLKAGLTLDGRVATESGESQWITSEAARKDARRERSLSDAVLVGSGTVAADNPELAAHGKFKNKDLLRVIIDSKLSLDPQSKVFRDENVLVACTDLASKTRSSLFEKSGIAFKSFGKEEVSFKKLFEFLAECDIQSIYVEGGSAVHGRLFDAYLKDDQLLDQVLFYMAPKIIGGARALPVVAGGGVQKLKKVPEFQDFEVEVIEGDMKMRGRYNLY